MLIKLELQTKLKTVLSCETDGQEMPSCTEPTQETVTCATAQAYMSTTILCISNTYFLQLHQQTWREVSTDIAGSMPLVLLEQCTARLLRSGVNQLPDDSKP